MSAETTTRTELPAGVAPVAWSDRYQAWVLTEHNVPAGWKYIYFEADAPTWPGGWCDADEMTRRPDHNDLVLARPAPARTERVPWWEAVGREVVDGERIISVKRVEGELPFAITSVGDTVFPDPDGTIEVLA